MVVLVANFTCNFRVVEKVVGASPTYAARAIQPVLIDVLTKRKLRPPPLLGPNGHGQFRKNTMEAREVEPKRDFRVRRYGELDLEQLTHIVSHLGQIFLALVARLRRE
jgi:hypothetical protein